MHVTLSQFAGAIGRAINMSADTRNQWVVAELSSVNFRGIHCYLDLIEKDAGGQTVAKMRANIWASHLGPLRSKFYQATGKDLCAGLKVLLYGYAAMSAQYGLSMIVTDIDPSYTLGDAERLRREILEKLRKDGLLERNRQLTVPVVAQRIAVISSETAAGYGDFMNQLIHNPYGYVFYTCLFQAVMQGVNVPATVCEALERIEMSVDLWDCVVIIRGGGATSDLEGFDDYSLARAVATFPLPVIVGIGHERDRTVLDEIAGVRVKTPTAAAEWLINRAHEADLQLTNMVQTVMHCIADSVSGARRQLDYYASVLPLAGANRIAEARNCVTRLSGALPMAITASIERNRRYLGAAGQAVSNAGVRCLAIAGTRLDTAGALLRNAVPELMRRKREQLQSMSSLLQALSPENTLKRGYSITTVNGKAVTDAAKVPAGTRIETQLYNGTLVSTT